MAVFGGNALLLCGGVLGVVMGASVGVRVRVGLAIIACLSLSSAPLAHRFLESEGDRVLECFVKCVRCVCVAESM